MSVNEIPPSLIPAPEGYADWLTDLKGRIHTAQQRATLAVNRELVQLYWGRSGAIFWRGRQAKGGGRR